MSDNPEEQVIANVMMFRTEFAYPTMMVAAGSLLWVVSWSRVDEIPMDGDTQEGLAVPPAGTLGYDVPLSLNPNAPFGNEATHLRYETPTFGTWDIFRVPFFLLRGCLSGGRLGG